METVEVVVHETRDEVLLMLTQEGSVTPVFIYHAHGRSIIGYISINTTGYIIGIIMA